jgi:dephospho-CoA kinase
MNVFAGEDTNTVRRERIGSTTGRPLAVALTGGIACGKSEVQRCLEAAGVPVLDTDRVAHEVMEPGGAAYSSVVGRFGKAILEPDGRIDRQRLARRVFAERTALEALNRSVHPHVERRWRAWLAARKADGESAVVAIPLLFEVGAADGWDAILCVAARRRDVLGRLRQRGLRDEEAQRRLAAQWPIEEKMKRSDAVIMNDGSLAELAQRVRAVWRKITGGD